MALKKVANWLIGSVLILGIGACGVLTQATVGYLKPGTENTTPFAWEPVTGAASYQVIVSLDRAGRSPVGTSALVSTNQLTEQQIAWRSGYPRTDRAYFWVVRAFDRNDPRGVLLTISLPTEVRFSPPQGGIGLTYNDAQSPETSVPTPARSAADAFASGPAGAAPSLMP